MKKIVIDQVSFTSRERKEVLLRAREGQKRKNIRMKRDTYVKAFPAGFYPGAQLLAKVDQLGNITYIQPERWFPLYQDHQTGNESMDETEYKYVLVNEVFPSETEIGIRITENAEPDSIGKVQLKTLRMGVGCFLSAFPDGLDEGMRIFILENNGRIESVLPEKWLAAEQENPVKPTVTDCDYRLDFV